MIQSYLFKFRCARWCERAAVPLTAPSLHSSSIYYIESDQISQGWFRAPASLLQVSAAAASDFLSQCYNGWGCDSSCVYMLLSVGYAPIDVCLR